jgi:N-acetylneuraminate synthase
MSSPPPVVIGDRSLGSNDDTYVIAEIGSNFDSSKQRAKKLIELAADCGADAAKFQAFTADRILSQPGFDDLKMGFQSEWDKPVYEVYQDAELPRDWIDDLAAHCEAQGVDFLCTPYDWEAVDLIEDVVPAYKIGSGDITWLEYLEYVAEKGKPIILATGASTMADIERAVEAIRSAGNEDLILLQCVTNYPSEFESANIRAMDTLREAFETPVGYSDHTPGVTVPLGAVARGGCVIEKHFTDDKSRDGPDHPHSLNPTEFDRLVTEIRQLDTALGSAQKRIYKEEQTPVVLQQRSLRAATDLEPGEQLTEEKLTALRPAPENALRPRYKDVVVGRTVEEAVGEGEAITWDVI